ncbi:hypothetical protein NEUTE1DRAFT_117079 [Neurospora tetrasperma FGSC 2508]|uniref:Uncharacterized protein n=1 Tax=Neurospora tetrasperma (strain FGSC 2508 / ATCC MYA-4615 / P0657) TaxID=510951 RepID=F8MJW4_NEUT8|nr:uncharacterized protein NEUTE1DRAFT_117079 [Neurospora tetrasperma FGSC 2508]EGO58151.1 hypothetical protein NEUTE1DRAFT_117079 [Neurospora tetrasperma FGSC 2508]EGZ71539.1 hypothetical protein NEUTE2DRAFT_144529 [Neurospora tetrasperma FGSC 2509]
MQQVGVGCWSLDVVNGAKQWCWYGAPVEEELLAPGVGRCGGGPIQTARQARQVPILL